jgi:hypothetical protein
MDGSLIKELSDSNTVDVNHDRHVNAAVVAICVQDLTKIGDGRDDRTRMHVIAARSDGSVVVWDYEAVAVSSSFRDYDEDVCCLALLDVNFALLDSLNDGGFRYSNVNSKQGMFDYGIVTGSSSGMIKIWKYNAFGGGWMQCFEISTAVEDANHGGGGISSLRVLWNDLIPLGQDSSIKNVSHFQLVTGYLDGSINLWDIETKTITMVLHEKGDLDVSFQRANCDLAVTDLCVTKRIDGYEIICGRNNRQIMLWKNIDINNVPGIFIYSSVKCNNFNEYVHALMLSMLLLCIHGDMLGYGFLRELVKKKHWFSLHVLYKRFGWMLFNVWQSNAETLFTYTLLILKNRHISALIDSVCTYNNPDPRSLTKEDVSEKYTPSYCWLGVKTRRHDQSILSVCVEKRVYNDIKFTLDAWKNVFNSDNIDLFDELQDSFHFHLAEDDLTLVAEEYSPLFCEFLMNISSQKSHDWILGARVRDKFRKREDNMKMKSFDRWYQKKYLEVNKKKQIMNKDGVGEQDPVVTTGSFWDSDHNAHNLAYFDIVDTDGLSLISMYEQIERETEYRTSLAEDPEKSSYFQSYWLECFRVFEPILATLWTRGKLGVRC